MIRGRYVPGQHRLNVELPNVDDTTPCYSLGIERADGEDDPSFTVMHDKELSLAELHTFTGRQRKGRWDQKEMPEHREQLHSKNGDYEIFLTYPQNETWNSDSVKRHFESNYS